MNFELNKTNIIIGTIIVLLSGIIGYKVIQTPKVDNNSEPQVVIKEDNIINEYLEKEFSKVLKIFSSEVKKSAQSMVKFNDQFLLKNDYLNFRNSLYTKDIEKQFILIDTKNLCHCTDKHNYEINFNNNDNNETGGFDVYKNVIGFRLIKATLQNLLYQIHDGNYKVYFKYNNITYEATLRKKSYSNNTLAEELKRALNDAVNSQVFYVKWSTNYKKYIIYTRPDESSDDPFTSNLVDEYINDPTTENISITGHNFQFLFNTGLQNGYSNSRIFGFNEEDQTDDKNIRISNNFSDLSIHYVDLVVDEIPYIACKKNPTGKSIIDRIPIDVNYGSLLHYRSPITEYFSQNYFYPITLDKLTISLFEDSHDIPYYNENADNYFEFEITMLKNTKLSN